MSPAPSPLPPVTLVLGGTRSGKSLYAEQLIGTQPALYLATAQVYDDEMADRVQRHRKRRGPLWETREEPLDLPGALAETTHADRPVLVDCLTLWLSNLLLAERAIDDETARLCTALKNVRGPVVLVSSEVGLGIVPDNALARAFRDHAGLLNQSVASVADRVVFVAAGLPLTLKGQDR